LPRLNFKACWRQQAFLLKIPNYRIQININSKF